MFEIYTQWVERPEAASGTGHSLALKIAEKKLGYIPEIHTGENGKPYIDGLFFNISHSHSLVVCAFSDCEIGIDVEKIREYRPRVAEKFHPEEISRLEKAIDKDLEFFKIWTMKEAYVKCSAVGISKALSFNVFDIPNIYTEIRDGYVISVCTKEAAIV